MSHLPPAALDKTTPYRQAKPTLFSKLSTVPIMRSVEDVQDWLHSIGFERFCDVFRDNEIDGEVLSELTQDDLSRLGLPLGPAKKILKSINILINQGDVPPGHTWPPANAVDSNAGIKAPSMPPTDPAHLSLHSAERRQVTVMFCDLVGSTQLASQFDPEDLSTILLFFRDACSKTVVEYDGFIARYLGDGLLVYFGYPMAREDDAERALRVGRAIIDSVRTLKPFPGLKLQVRIGIATGMVVGGESVGADSPHESVVMGETPNLAARLQGLAKPNTIIVSDKTRQLVGSAFEYADYGRHSLKGFDMPVPAFKVVGEIDSVSRFNRLHTADLLPIVGRDNEIALLLERWQQVVDGDGQFVVLSGDPGFGKSRIATEVIDKIKRAGEASIVYLQCSPYHMQSALFPVTHYLANRAKFSASDSDEQRCTNLAAFFSDIPELGNEAFALICNSVGVSTPHSEFLNSMSPPQIRLRTLQSLTELFVGVAKSKPALLLLEDVQWIDPTTKLLIDQSLESIERQRIMILATERPGPNPPFSSHPMTTRLALNRLGRNPVKQIIQAVSNNIEIPQHVIDEIVAKTDGVPLFVEELTKTVVESRTFDRDTLAPDNLQIPLQQLAIPSSLQDSLMERLDRLAFVKEFAQVAAVIGREFSFALLTATLDRSLDEVHHALDKLVDADLITSIGHPPDSIYTFKHTLIRDTAYESLLKRRRQHWHSRVAVAIETKFPERMKYEPEVAAQHFSDAGLFEIAVRYWTDAAELSLNLFNNQEATTKARRGLSELEKTGESEQSKQLALRLHMVRALALRGLGGFAVPDSINSFISAMALAEELGDETVYVSATRGLCVARYLTGNLDGAKELALSLIGDNKSADYRLGGHLILGQVLCYLGDPINAHANLQSCRDIIESQSVTDDNSALAHQMDTLCVIEQFMQQTLDIQCSFDQALLLSEKAVNRARELSQPFAIAATLTHQCLTHLRLRLPFASQAQELAQITAEYGMEFWGAWAMFCSAIVKRDAGDVEDALADIIATKKHLESLNVALAFTTILSQQAELLLRLGQYDEGLDAIAQSLQFIDTTNERYNISELYRLKGQLLLGRGDDHGQALECFETGIDYARQQHALLWELRCLVSLANACRNNKRREQVQERLRSIILPLKSSTREILDLVDANEALQLSAPAI